MKLDLRNMDLDHLNNLMDKLGEPAYRARQIFAWVHGKGAESVDAMTDLPKSFRQKLEEITRITTLPVLKCQVSVIDGTRKYLLRLEDGNTLETVLMIHREAKGDVTRRTICLSTQVGCAMGCGFCATGKSGFIRNLTTSEIVSQLLTVQKSANTPVNNIVFMGMGEPLLNYDHVLRAIKIFNNPYGQNVGIRRISISTCGIVPGILRLAQEKLQVVLAVSLHAPNDAKRNEIMPINRKYPLAELMAACADYIAATKRRITYEYALIKEFNDSKKDAEELAHLIRGQSANVNLIPLNPVAGVKYARPDEYVIKQFVDILRRFGVEVVIREEKGADIQAACGQLRRRHAEC